MTDIIHEAIIAEPNPDIYTSGANLKAINKVIPLITKLNNPKDKNVIGNANNFIIGLIVKFNAPKKIDTINNPENVPMCIPLIINDVKYMDKAGEPIIKISFLIIVKQSFLNSII